MRGPITLLQDAWGIFSGNIKLFAGIYLIQALAVLVIFAIAFGAFVTTAGFNPFASEEELMEALFTSTSFITFIIATCAMMAVYLLFTIALTRAVAAPSDTTILGSYRSAFPYFWSYLWVGLLVSLAVLAGFLLFIIPGIIFAVWFMFAYYALLFEEKRGVEALKTSKRYVKGHWWGVLGRIAFVTLVAMIASFVLEIGITIMESVFGSAGVLIGSLASFALNIIIVPVMVAYVYLMYKDLSSGVAAADDMSTSPASQSEVATAQNTV